jgi:hypothetical protein
MTGVLEIQDGAEQAAALARPVPWSSDQQWRAAQGAFRAALALPADRLARARKHAEAIAHHLDNLADLFDQVAAVSCAVCPEPCCRRAKVWLTFQDLLFLHLHDEPLPPRQLRGGLHEPCRYLGARGCRLPRRSRPWICAWYICPALGRALVRDVPGGRAQATAWQTRIKMRRDAMETAFLEALGVAPAV